MARLRIAGLSLIYLAAAMAPVLDAAAFGSHDHDHNGRPCHVQAFYEANGDTLCEDVPIAGQPAALTIGTWAKRQNISATGCGKPTSARAPPQ